MSYQSTTPASITSSADTTARRTPTSPPHSDPVLEIFLDAFHSRKAPEDAGPLCGRVLRGKTEADFALLSPDPDRRIVFLTGGAGLIQFIGKGTEEILFLVGYSADDIRRWMYEEQNQFKLFVGLEGGSLQRATWRNTVGMACRLYPEVRHLLDQQADSLASAPFNTIEKLAGYSFAEVDQNGLDDPRYMSVERFAASRGGLLEARAFLYHTLQLRELFSGDGFTRTSDGVPGVSEYIAPNIPLTSLGDYRLIDLP